MVVKNCNSEYTPWRNTSIPSSFHLLIHHPILTAGKRLVSVVTLNNLDFEHKAHQPDLSDLEELEDIHLSLL